MGASGRYDCAGPSATSAWLPAKLSGLSTPSRFRTAFSTPPAATGEPACARPAQRPIAATPTAGLTGGKGVPETISAHPCVFATFTAPSAISGTTPSARLTARHTRGLPAAHRRRPSPYRAEDRQEPPHDRDPGGPRPGAQGAPRHPARRAHGGRITLAGRRLRLVPGQRRPIGRNADWDSWKALLKTASVRDARLHDARHTAATLLPGSPTAPTSAS